MAVTASLPETATDGNRLTPWRCGGLGADADVTASATTSTHVSENSTLVACATDRRDLRVRCADIPEGDCDCDGNVLDECGICGGDGIPAGDCDCDGNQLDALGECGGPCEADADADGICDDVDPCVGELDACGVCNGPGEIYECGALTSLKEIATVTETSLTSAASVAVTASLPETATAMATSLTPSENAEVLVRPMRRRWHLRRRRPMCRRADACGVCNGPGRDLRVRMR